MTNSNAAPITTTIPKTATLTDAVGCLEPIARVNALRAVVHSCMTRSFGYIRSSIREDKQRQRNEALENSDLHPELESDEFTKGEGSRMDATGMNSLDDRNHYDEDHRLSSGSDAFLAADEVKYNFGFATRSPPLLIASQFKAAYNIALDDCNTLITNRFDRPMKPKAMLAFMLCNSSPLKPELVHALAKAMRVSPAIIEKLHETRIGQDRKQLQEDAPIILSTFDGFGDNGHESALEDLPIVVRHQIGIKIADSLNKLRISTPMRIMRSNSIADIANIPLIEDASNAFGKWLLNFEDTHDEELIEAFEAGKNVRTVEDTVADYQLLLKAA